MSLRPMLALGLATTALLTGCGKKKEPVAAAPAPVARKSSTPTPTTPTNPALNPSLRDPAGTINRTKQALDAAAAKENAAAAEIH